MSALQAARTPWEFRFRAFFIAVAFGLGFFFGYPLQALLFHNDVDPTFVMIGRLAGESGTTAAAWIAASIAVAAWLVRWWGSSYLSPGVVMSGDVVADEFTAAGPYRYVRNPLYLGNLLLALSIGSLGPPVATVLVVALNLGFVYRLIAVEERCLRGANGPAYQRYCDAVPRLLPHLVPASLPEDARSPKRAYGFLTELFSLGLAGAMVSVAIVAPHGGARNTAFTFWSIAGLAIVVQAAVSSAACRAGAEGS